MSHFTPAPKPQTKMIGESKIEEKFAEKRPHIETKGLGDEKEPKTSPPTEKLTIFVILESPESASNAFNLAARTLHQDYSRNPLDFELTLLGITRIMLAEVSSPRWEFKYNFLAVKRKI